MDALIAKGDIALKQIDQIAPRYNEYCYNQLNRLLKENEDTCFGREHHFSDIRNYDDYQKKVPLTDYSDYAEWIRRISEKGEKNVLTTQPIVHFTVTSGTVSEPKLFPVTKKGMDLCTVYTVPAIMANIRKALKKNGRSLPREKGLVMMDFGLDSFTETGIRKGGISGASIRKHIKEIEKITVTPREVISADQYLDSKYLHALFALKERKLSWIASSYMTVIAGLLDCMEMHWEKLCGDIEKGEISPDIEMADKVRQALNSGLKPDPKRAEELRTVFRDGFSAQAIGKRIWPKLSGISAIGSGSFRIHAEKVRRFAGEEVQISFSVIEASESLIAIAAGCNTDDFIMVPQAGFFEFIPEGEDETILPVDQVEVGKKYELVLTTISGLYRYRIGDVVMVSGHYGQIPIIQFSHRINVFLNIAGEKTSEFFLSKVIKGFEEKTGITVAEYCAYADTNDTPGHYVLLLEPTGLMDMSRVKEYEEIIEEELLTAFGYRYERQSGNIHHAELLIQQIGTHLLYRELQIMKGAGRNQLKPVRIPRTPEQLAFFTKMIEKDDRIE